MGESTRLQRRPRIVGFRSLSTRSRAAANSSLVIPVAMISAIMTSLSRRPRTSTTSSCDNSAICTSPQPILQRHGLDVAVGRWRTDDVRDRRNCRRRMPQCFAPGAVSCDSSNRLRTDRYSRQPRGVEMNFDRTGLSPHSDNSSAFAGRCGGSQVRAHQAPGTTPCRNGAGSLSAAPVNVTLPLSCKQSSRKIGSGKHKRSVK